MNHFRSSSDVNQFSAVNTSHENTTCDELDNPDHSRHKRSAVRRRKCVFINCQISMNSLFFNHRRSKSPRKQMPSEILDAIK